MISDWPKLNNDLLEFYPASNLFDSSKCVIDSFALLVGFWVFAWMFGFGESSWSIENGLVLSFCDLPAAAPEFI